MSATATLIIKNHYTYMPTNIGAQYGPVGTGESLSTWMTRMKQIAPRTRAGLKIVGVKENLTKEQLAGIGLTAIAFNEAEATLREIFGYGLRLSYFINQEVASRIANIDNVLELAKIGGRQLEIPKHFQKIFQVTFEGFVEVKTLRDLVIHACVFDRRDAIGEVLKRKGKIFEILLSNAALDALTGRIEFVWRELREIGDIYGMYAQAHRDRQTRSMELKALVNSPRLTEITLRLRAWQECRRALPTYPKIPKARATMQPHVTRPTPKVGARK